MALNKIYMGGDLYIGGGGGGAAEISKEEGNALVQKADGLYVPTGAVEISKEEGNIIKSKADGIYAMIDFTDDASVKAIQKIISDNLETEDIDFSDF